MNKTFTELTDGIKSFEDIVAKLGEKVEDILPHETPTTIRQKINNDNAKLDYIAQYLKQGNDENYYFPVFDKQASNASGFGFLSSSYAAWAHERALRLSPLVA